MTVIKDLATALKVFDEAAIKHAEATRKGDYKVGNKNYNRVVKAVSYLKEHDDIDELLCFLDHDNLGVRVAAATFLLPRNERRAIEVLKEVSRSSDFYSFIAETTLSEWRKGNLRL